MIKIIEPDILKTLVYSSYNQDEIAAFFKCSKRTIEKKIAQNNLQLQKLPIEAHASRYLNRQGEKVTVKGDRYIIGGYIMTANEVVAYANELKKAGGEGLLTMPHLMSAAYE